MTRPDLFEPQNSYNNDQDKSKQQIRKHQIRITQGIAIEGNTWTDERKKYLFLVDALVNSNFDRFFYCQQQFLILPSFKCKHKNIIRATAQLHIESEDTETYSTYLSITEGISFLGIILENQPLQSDIFCDNLELFRLQHYSAENAKNRDLFTFASFSTDHL
ncbi:hypothetical protein X798_04157 [Onchocerca flexuosa]|uniref:Uncharacterized protein n=1 Tax=Onchocerca flexuosa TaxID=387005 RepID=A0A238BU01_9BILA|nr:hypothetical protein X798_04157 [Onchocerca flexuosa]